MYWFMPTGQPHLDNPSSRLFSQVIVDCVKQTVKTDHHILRKVIKLQPEWVIIYINSLPIFFTGFCETESRDYIGGERGLEGGVTDTKIREHSG